MEAGDPGVAVAAFLADEIADGAFPSPDAWQRAAPVRFSWDWRGENADPPRETQVRLLWRPEFLALQFRAAYRRVTVFADADARGRRDHLWDRDVAETFLQPHDCDPLRYREFEVSPNGFWIDLDIIAGEKGPAEARDLQSGLRCRARIDQAARVWTAELVLPMNALTRQFDPARSWRVNFFRAEGEREPRFYSAWRPTGTPQPNFHVPSAFGVLKFSN